MNDSCKLNPRHALHTGGRVRRSAATPRLAAGAMPRPAAVPVMRAALVALLTSALWMAAPQALAQGTGAAGPAAPAAPVLGDLSTAYNAALAHDPQLRAAAAAVQAARDGVAVAEGRFYPQVGANASTQLNHMRRQSLSTERQDVSDYRSYNLSLVARQALLTRPQQAERDRARARLAESEAGEQEARHQVALRVAEAWFELLLADELARQVRAQIASHEAQLAASRRGLERGEGTRTDIDEAQARLDLDAAQALQAAQMRTRALQRLRQLTGRPAGSPGALVMGGPADGLPDVGVLEDWFVRAERASPELRALQARVEQAEAAVATSRARSRPTLDLVAQVSQGQRESINNLDELNRNVSLGLQFSMPLYTGGSLQAAERQSVAERVRAEELLAAQRLDLRLRLQDQFRGVVEGAARARAMQQLVRSATQALQSARQSVRAGARSLVDVLDAEQRVATAQRELAQAGHDTLLAALRLEALAGTLDQTTMDRLSARLREGRP